MKNFKDKLELRGRASKTEKIITCLEELPDGTFPPIEGDLHGNDQMMKAKIKELDSFGNPHIILTYLPQKEGKRKIVLPSNYEEISFIEKEEEYIFEISSKNSEAPRYTIRLPNKD